MVLGGLSRSVPEAQYLDEARFFVRSQHEQRYEADLMLQQVSNFLTDATAKMIDAAGLGDEFHSSRVQSAGLGASVIVQQYFPHARIRAASRFFGHFQIQTHRWTHVEDSSSLRPRTNGRQIGEAHPGGVP